MLPALNPTWYKPLSEGAAQVQQQNRKVTEVAEVTKTPQSQIWGVIVGQTWVRFWGVCEAAAAIFWVFDHLLTN